MPNVYISPVNEIRKLDSRIFLARCLALLVLVQIVLIISGMTQKIIFPTCLFFIMFSHNFFKTNKQTPMVLSKAGIRYHRVILCSAILFLCLFHSRTRC